jgi:hypothetical protein
MTRTITRKAIRNIGRALQRAFLRANEEEHVEPVFNEAAEGDGDSGGFDPVEFHKGILPGIRDTISADGKQNVMLRNQRESSASFSRENLLSIHIQ